MKTMIHADLMQWRQVGPKHDLVDGVLEAFYLNIVEACVQILNKYESLFILVLHNMKRIKAIDLLKEERTR